MTRAEKRRLQKQIAKGIEPKEFKDKVMKELLVWTIAVPCIVLRDKYNFEKQELGDFAEEVSNQILLLQKEKVTLDDLINIIYEETGVQLIKSSLD